MMRKRKFQASRLVALTWPKTLAKVQGILKENLLRFSFGLFACFFPPSFWYFLQLLFWQVEIEQKKSLKPDFEGDEMDNPKECGIQWQRATISRNPDPRVMTECLLNSWSLSQSCWGHSMIRIVCQLPVCSYLYFNRNLRRLLWRGSLTLLTPEACGSPDFWSLLYN
jgi:hypothetical protein